MGGGCGGVPVVEDLGEEDGVEEEACDEAFVGKSVWRVWLLGFGEVIVGCEGRCE